MSEKEKIKTTDKAVSKPRLKFIYPQVHGMENKELQSKINQIIREQVFFLIKDSNYKEGTDLLFIGGYKSRNEYVEPLILIFELDIYDTKCKLLEIKEKKIIIDHLEKKIKVFKTISNSSNAYIPSGFTLELKQKFLKLSSINDEEKKSGSCHIHYHIHVANLYIQDPVIKEMIYNLDKLDIEELSGTLNIGNTLGVKIEKKKTKDKDKS